MQIPVLVINLDRSRERLADMTKKLDALNIKFERIPAVDGKTLTENERRAFYRKRIWRRENTVYEIGAYMSHMKALRHMVENKMEKAIILEDDLEFNGAFQEIASGRYDLDFEFDIIKLEGIRLGNQKYVRFASQNRQNIIYITSPTHGAAAYIITLKGALRVLKRLSRMNYPIDDDLFCNWRNGLVFYDFFPYPARQAEAPQTHMIDRVATRKAGMEKHIMRLIRILPKNYDKINKYLFQLRRFGAARLKPRDLDELICAQNGIEYSAQHRS
jgi:glycosyl transferase family 25